MKTPNQWAHDLLQSTNTANKETYGDIFGVISRKFSEAIAAARADRDADWFDALGQGDSDLYSMGTVDPVVIVERYNVSRTV
jgi:hypothetical protein